ncbi:MAG: PAS domain S-box protein [Proteobacteria bacterium]|nr:PAS domain S-box protein [Pseudomonadota bacterium]
MAERELEAERSAHLAAIVDNSFDAIVSKDLNGVVRSWNKAAERIFGWSADEIVGNSIRLLIPEDRGEEEDRILAKVRAGERVPKFETVRRRKDGSPVPVAITVSPLLDGAGKIIGASKIAHDISEIVDARTQLEESERQFRMLANSIPQLAWIADGDGSIFWYNDRWYDYTGTTLDQMFGWGWTAVHHPDHVERVKTRIRHSWDTGEVWEDTFPLRGRDGQYRWFLSRAMPMRGSDGRLWRWFGTNTDITAQREHEQKIDLLMGEVSHRAKNMLALVQAVVNRTADPKFADTLGGRLQALARNQDLLTRRSWLGVPLGELIESQLAIVADLLGSRITLAGALDLVLVPSSAETIGLAIHELATNATKYGALSGAAGQLRIVCAVDADDLVISWEESDGPTVAAPVHRGFGTVMIDQNPRLSLGAKVEYGYPAGGFHWRMTAALAHIT